MEFVYVLADGKHSKIGRTNNLKRRLKEYYTCNPTVSLTNSWTMTKSLTIEVENKVKEKYKKNRVGNGKQWFSIHPREMVENVNQIIKELEIACHTQTSKKKKTYNYNIELTEHGKVLLRQKNIDQFIKHFSEVFDTGIPQSEILNDPNCLCIEDIFANVDIDSYTISKNNALINGFSHDYLKNAYKFYQKLPLDNGRYYAVCSSIVVFSEERIDTLTGLNDANEFNLYFINNTKLSGWNWLFNDSHVYLYTSRVATIDDLWSCSFRKWFIENCDIIPQLTSLDLKVKEDVCFFNTFKDIVLNDNNFPLDITNKHKFIQYLRIRLGVNSGKILEIALQVVTFWRKNEAILGEIEIDAIPKLSPLIQVLVNIGLNKFEGLEMYGNNEWTEKGLRLKREAFKRVAKEANIGMGAFSRLINKIFKFQERKGKTWSQNMNGLYIWDSLEEYQNDLAIYLNTDVVILFDN